MTAPRSRLWAASTSASSSTTRTSTWRCGCGLPGRLPARPRGASVARLLGQPRRRQRREVRPHRLEPGIHAAPLRGDVATARRGSRAGDRECDQRRQVLMDRTAAGLRGRVRGSRRVAGPELRELDRGPCSTSAPGRPWPCAGGAAVSRASQDGRCYGSRASPQRLPQLSARESFLSRAKAWADASISRFAFLARSTRCLAYQSPWGLRPTIECLAAQL